MLLVTVALFVIVVVRFEGAILQGLPRSDKAGGRSKLTREFKQIDAQLGKQTGAELSASFVRRCLVLPSGLCRPVWTSRMTKPAEDRVAGEFIPAGRPKSILPLLLVEMFLPRAEVTLISQETQPQVQNKPGTVVKFLTKKGKVIEILVPI